jgi:hypothetical protein
MSNGQKDVPPGTNNPPRVKATLIKAFNQIGQIETQLNELKKTIEKIRCEEPRRRKPGRKK